MHRILELAKQLAVLAYHDGRERRLEIRPEARESWTELKGLVEATILPSLFKCSSCGNQHPIQTLGRHCHEGEKGLREILARLDREHRQHCEPYIKALADIEALKPPKPFIFLPPPGFLPDSLEYCDDDGFHFKPGRDVA